MKQLFYSVHIPLCLLDRYRSFFSVQRDQDRFERRPGSCKYSTAANLTGFCSGKTLPSMTLPCLLKCQWKDTKVRQAAWSPHHHPQVWRTSLDHHSTCLNAWWHAGCPCTLDDWHEGRGGRGGAADAAEVASCTIR